MSELCELEGKYFQRNTAFVPSQVPEIYKLSLGFPKGETSAVATAILLRGLKNRSMRHST